MSFCLMLNIKEDILKSFEESNSWTVDQQLFDSSKYFILFNI